MGIWGTAIKDNDAFADVYSEFIELYNKGKSPDKISAKLQTDFGEILEIEEEKHSFWFALAFAQWETKSLDLHILSKVEEIITSGDDLKIWLALGASESDLKKRRLALEKFLQKIKSDRPKAKARRRSKLKTVVFPMGSCLVFKLKDGNYGGAVVLAVDTNPETAYNLVATTRLNQTAKPTLKDFEESEVLVRNFGQWNDVPDVTWYMPDLYHKDYSEIYESIGTIEVEVEYETKNYDGKGYLFQPSFTSGWSMNFAADSQFESEKNKPKPNKKLTIKQLIKKL